MVHSTDDGHKCACPVCKGIIKHREQGGIIDDGRNLRHADCVRDRYGYEAAKDRRWLNELIQRGRPQEMALAKAASTHLSQIQRQCGCRRVA